MEFVKTEHFGTVSAAGELSEVCTFFSFPFLRWEYVKGSVFVTWYPNFTPKKPTDNITLFIIIPNTNEFSQGQLGLLAKKAELT